MERRPSSQVTFGVLLIVIGLIFLGDQLNILFGWDFGRLWPLVLIVLGISKVASAPESAGSGGYMLVLVGVIFLMHTFRIMTLNQSWPLFIVASGLSILMGGRRRTPPGAPGHVE